MKTFQTDIIKRAVETFGNDQLGIAQEELSELIQAISKYRRSFTGDFDRQKAINMLNEEIVDVEICIKQLRRIINADISELHRIRHYKLKRLENTILDRQVKENRSVEDLIKQRNAWKGVKDEV